MTNREAISPHLENVARLELNRSDKQARDMAAWSVRLFAWPSMGPQAWTWALPTAAEEEGDE